jgi:hypothetical protein
VREPVMSVYGGHVKTEGSYGGRVQTMSVYGGHIKTEGPGDNECSRMNALICPIYNLHKTP